MKTCVTVCMLLVTGTLLHAADASAPVKLTHDWPSWSGPEGLLAGKSTVPVLDDFSQARLAWVNEQDDLGYAKTTSGGGHCYPTSLWPSGCSSLIVAGGLVLTGYFRPHDEIRADDVVVAVDAATGATRWKQTYTGQGVNRGASKHPRYGAIPVAADGRVFHLGSAGLVYALDLATGKPLWQADVGPFREQLLAILKRTEGKPAAERAAETDRWWPYATRSPLQVVDGVLLVPFGPWVAKDSKNPASTDEEREARKRNALFAFDAATGKSLWKMTDGSNDGSNACAVKLGDKTYALTASKFGMLRLFEARSGRVLWEQFLGISHGIQPLVAGGRTFVMGARDPQPGVFAPDAHLTVFSLSESGAKRLWQSEHVFRQISAWTPLAYRDGIIYAGLVPTSETREGAVFAFRAEDGRILGRLSGSWLFHLWGDRLVRPGDVNHESMNFPCTYTAVTGDLGALELSGKPFAFRHQAPYKGVCGYEVLMHHPFVDGYLFTRAVDCVKGKGVILCWDLRATGKPAKPASGKQMEPKGTTKGRNNAMPLNQDAAPKKKDTPPPNVEIEDLPGF